MSKERFLTVLIPIKDSDCEAAVYADLSSLSSAVPANEANINKIYKTAKEGYARVWLNPSTGMYQYHIVTDREFPYLGRPLEIFDFTYDATRMGNAPTISAQGIMWYADKDAYGEDVTLDGLWTQMCHVIFNGEKLYLKQIPTSSKSNEDARYKYDLDFVSDRVSLERVYLYDVVSPFVTERPVSENSSFSFYGDINELAKRINASLIRSGLASLVRKYVAYPQYPSMNVPYLTYEQWNMVNADPSALYGSVFGSEDEILMFYSDIYTALGADYNRYLMSYIYENTNGVYDLNGYQCKIGNDKYGNPSTSEEKLITFENNTIHEALQQFHDTFELEYYITCEKDSSGNFTGNTWIMVADCEYDFADIDASTGDYVRDADGIPTSSTPFEYGDTEALLSKQKTNTTDKVVTRITGVGSSENIPWYYPNPNTDGWIKPFYTRDGAEFPSVTVDYPVDEGTTTADAVRYEKYLKNRIGKSIKKGAVNEVLYGGNYIFPSVGMILEDGNMHFMVKYEIDVKGLTLQQLPRMTLELDYNPTASGCNRVVAMLSRGGETVGLYDSQETYQNPTDFQSMFIHPDGKHKQNLAGGNYYILDIDYTVPTSALPNSDTFDFEGYLYPSVYYDEWGTLANLSAYVGENFYNMDGLQPYLEFQPPYPTPHTALYTLVGTGYSINGEASGKVAPIPRREGKLYKNLSNGKIYKCTTSETVDIEHGTNADAFEENPKMLLDEWLDTFVNMTLRVYRNDGWYIGYDKIELEDYGLDLRPEGGTAFGAEIFDSIEFQRLKWVTPVPNLMPEVFIKTDGERRFYNAHNYYPLQAGTADTAVGEEQVGSDVRNPIYKENETDPDDKHYDFESEYLQSKPHEHIENFDDVKPTIKEQTNTVDGSVIRIDVVETFDYDATDNNEIWDSNEEETIQGDYKHPYFFAKLRPMGFNIFDLATTDDMVLSMTTGNCGACNFKIGVDERTGKNPVQVWEYDVYDSDDPNTAQLVYEAGTLRRYVNLAGLYYDTSDGLVPVAKNMLIVGGGQSDYLTSIYDRYTYSEESVEKGLVGGVKQDGKKHFEGDVVTNGRFLESQQDTSENYVWVALMKDTEAYGVIMPSAIPNYNDPAYNQYIEPKGVEYTNRANGEQSTLTEDQADKFVLTNIRLPQIYLRRAEHKLSRELVKYMYEHNWQRFNFSIKFSRIYIEGDSTVDDNLNENSVLYVKYDGNTYRQYAKHYTYKMSHNEPLPEVNVDMNDELSVSRTLTQQWDVRLAGAGRRASYHTGNVATQTRDIAQKHYKGKYDDLFNPSSTSDGDQGTDYVPTDIQSITEAEIDEITSN